MRPAILSQVERSGLLAMHARPGELDPNHGQLGLTRVPIITDDFCWLCRRHYEEWAPRIPETIAG